MVWGEVWWFQTQGKKNIVYSILTDSESTRCPRSLEPDQTQTLAKRNACLQFYTNRWSCAGRLSWRGWVWTKSCINSALTRESVKQVVAAHGCYLWATLPQRSCWSAWCVGSVWCLRNLSDASRLMNSLIWISGSDPPPPTVCCLHNSYARSAS